MDTTTTPDTTSPDTAPVIDDPRILALAAHLELDADDAADITEDDDDRHEYSFGRQSYLVLTDEEADDAARESLRETLWAFQSSFLRQYIPALRNGAAAQAFDKMRESLCEDANDLVAAMLGEREAECIDDAIACDGRGHTLAGYDGEEYDAEIDGERFYIYRTN